MVPLERHDGRAMDELREVRVHPDFVGSADGSCLIEFGRTRVLCTAVLCEELPRWRQGSGLGWVTAEYGMLPGSTPGRKPRPILKPDSRSVEIQRLIGRAVRNVVDFEKLSGLTVNLDCDVIEADAGTRTASITGAYIALARAIDALVDAGRCPPGVLTGKVAGVSVGMISGECILDLDYQEDSSAEVDMNVAMTDSGRFVEVQGTAEGAPFSADELDEMLSLARVGIERLFEIQTEAIAWRQQ